MARIGIVEDDKSIAATLTINLQSFGHTVDHFDSAEAFLHDGLAKHYNLLLIDFNLPRMNGLSLCQYLRDLFQDLLLVVLTAKTDEKTAVACLQAGANDFIRKPVGFHELRVRIEKLLKSQNNVGFERKGLLLNSDKFICTYNGKEIPLTITEFRILEILLSPQDGLVNRADLAARLDPHGHIMDRSLDSHISRLRTKLKSAKVDQLEISAVYGIGYKVEWVND
ncbi:response regulator transcription factor [Bdellovibrio sp.]|uniref:response regulator transcription factor n=1 Tax=Bdellovibrio sp. TaxID=28201 RepID=UPI0039E6E652